MCRSRDCTTPLTCCSTTGVRDVGEGYYTIMEFILWILAVILVISGIVAIVRGSLLWGIVLIVVGLLVGPGGVSVFT
ncbi:hypothetical protein LX16_4640 [Stackebrandtia albiflava]|uniref:Uncharacterized protein n=1 Tax=Stackebrandtia albiflava TaxID=406432 RepID=A0A562UQG5_9ACTN|nr:hypothetical protein LX16_4640 [Stackebrandtia albiflava]